jgi:hypothetical protein
LLCALIKQTVLKLDARLRTVAQRTDFRDFFCSARSSPLETRRESGGKTKDAGHEVQMASVPKLLTGKPVRYLLSLLPFFAALSVAGLNLFLSGKQKQWLNDQTLRLWEWLANLQRHSLLDWLRYHSRWLARTAAVLATCYAVWIILNRSSPNPVKFGELLFVLILVGAGAWCGVKFIYWTLHSRALFVAALRASLVLPLVYGTLFGFGVFANVFKELLTPQGGVVTVFDASCTHLYPDCFIYWADLDFLGCCHFSAADCLRSYCSSLGFRVCAPTYC